MQKTDVHYDGKYILSGSTGKAVPAVGLCRQTGLPPSLSQTI